MSEGGDIPEGTLLTNPDPRRTVSAASKFYVCIIATGGIAGLLLFSAALYGFLYAIDYTR